MSAVMRSTSWRSTRARRRPSSIVEVRWRGSRAFGLPEETVDHRKRTRVRAAAHGLLDLRSLPDGAPIPRLPLRFDLVVVEPGDRIRHYRHAM